MAEPERNPFAAVPPPSSVNDNPFRPNGAGTASSSRDAELEARARGIVQANTHLNFVQRMLHPKDWPYIANPDGSYSTHLMMSSADDKGPFVFPSIVWDDKTQTLKKFSEEDWRGAAHHAQKTGELIRFDTPQEAEWFGTHGYKLGSDIERRNSMGSLEPSRNMLKLPETQAPDPNSGVMPPPQFSIGLGGQTAAPLPIPPKRHGATRK